MGKRSKRMISNMYENDILDLDTIEELEEILPIKENKAIKKSKKQAQPTQAKFNQETKILTKPVSATCNKCKSDIVGELVGDIYMPVTNKIMPLITYSCPSCGHIGRRSVISQALPLDQYEKKFFN